MRLEIVTLGIALCAVTACGGGVPDLVDETPPTLEASQPADGDGQARVGTPIRLTFSELIQHDVVVTVQVDDDPPQTASPQYSDAGRKTTVVIPEPPLAALPATLTVTLTNVRDAFENAVATPVTVRWTYPDWLPMGVQLSTSATPLLAAGPEGPVMAWLENGAVKVRIWNGASWDAPVDPIAASATSLSLITNAAGAPVVAYCDGAQFFAKAYGATGWANVATNALPAVPWPQECVGSGLAVEDGALHVAVAAVGINGWLRLYRLQGTSWSQRGPDYSITDGQRITGIAGTGSGVVIGLAATSLPWLPDASTSWLNLTNPGGTVSSVGALAGDPLAVVGVTAKRWDFMSSQWNDLGTFPSGTAGVSPLDTRGRTPVAVAHGGGSGGAAAYVLEWDEGSSSWVPLGRLVTGAAATGVVATEDAEGRVYRSANGVVSRYNRPPVP